MRRTLCKSKIHRARVTDANLYYEGSITIDAGLMEAADIVPYEQVAIVNVNNGERFETYAIRGEPGKGEICLNGAAARLGHKGDEVIIITYAAYEDAEVKTHQPKILRVDERNRIKNIS